MTIIRTARSCDAAALGIAHHTAWQETYRGTISDDYLDWLTPAISEKIFAHRAPSNILVAECDGCIVGFAVVGHGREADMPARSGELCGLYVLKAHQKTGLGKALFRAAEKRLCALGYRRMFLWVLSENHAAIQFYAHMGMQPDGRFKNTTLGTVVTECRMCKPLSLPPEDNA